MSHPKNKAKPLCNNRVKKDSKEMQLYPQKRSTDKNMLPCITEDPAEVPINLVALNFDDFIDGDKYKQYPDDEPTHLARNKTRYTNITDKSTTKPVRTMDVKNDKYKNYPDDQEHTMKDCNITDLKRLGKLYQKCDYLACSSCKFIRKNIDLSCNNNNQLQKNIHFIASQKIDSIHPKCVETHLSSPRQQNRICLLKRNNNRKPSRGRKSKPSNFIANVIPMKVKSLPIDRNSSTAMQYYKQQTKVISKRYENTPTRIDGVNSDIPYYGFKKTLGKCNYRKIERNKENSQTIKIGSPSDFVMGDYTKSSYSDHLTEKDARSKFMKLMKQAQSNERWKDCPDDRFILEFGEDNSICTSVEDLKDAHAFNELKGNYFPSVLRGERKVLKRCSSQDFSDNKDMSMYTYETTVDPTISEDTAISSKKLNSYQSNENFHTAVENEKVDTLFSAQESLSASTTRVSLLEGVERYGNFYDTSIISQGQSACLFDLEENLIEEQLENYVKHHCIKNEGQSVNNLLLKKRTPQEVKYGLLLPPNRNPHKIMLVFVQSDPVSDAMSRAADKLGFDVTSCSSYDGALEEYLSKLHDLVIIDARVGTKSLDYDTLCRSIRNTKGSLHTVVAAIVKKSAFDKDDITVLSLLDSGYSRCIVETPNIIHCVNELIQLKHSDIRPSAQAATSQALYAALDKCKDIVLITDDSYRLQYTNRASETLLGYRQDETLGKTLQEQLANDPFQINTMGSSLMRAREWSGQLSLKRKGFDPVVSVCKAIPIMCAGRVPTHFVMVMDLTGSGEYTALTPDKPRGSVHSIRRPSQDVRSVGSDILRRTSLAKLSALPLEAPITKVVALLSQAQDQSNTQVNTIIDKAIDVLRSTELYSPRIREHLKLKSDEPVTSDLITALLNHHPIQTGISTSRRSSNDSATVTRNLSRPSTKLKVPAQLKDLLETSLTWEFDIFKLEDLSNKKPLLHLGMNLFYHFDVASTLNCDEKTLYNWLTVIELNYRAENSYHNSTHAADVLQATSGFLERDRLKALMEPLDEATSLIAACAHDIDHPGKSSAFLSNSDNPLAIFYNDVTVLENHHAALMFKLTLGDERVNIFKNLDRETYKIARHNVIDMILATEMTKHFEHLAKFVNVFCAKSSRTDLETDDFIPIHLPENITLVKRMMIKCADVSNPTRPLRLCVEWSRRIAEEYFAQTDEEKSKNLPVVMPMFDRTTCSIPKSQIGFVDYIVHDMFEAWDAFIDMPDLVTYMRQNYIRWKEFDEQGYTTSSEIRKLQNTILAPPVLQTKNSLKLNE